MVAFENLNLNVNSVPFMGQSELYSEYDLQKAIYMLNCPKSLYLSTYKKH